MGSSASSAISRAFAEALGNTQRPPACSLIGVEHEFIVRGRSGTLDFRRMIHRLELPGRAIDPGDSNAYRLRSGIVVTCDGPEAEVAIPPVKVQPGFTDEIVRWTDAAGAKLRQLVPLRLDLEGCSTHISVGTPDACTVRVCRLFARTFGPAMMMLMDGPDSPGLLIRPRPNRVELCGEYATGRGLRAAVALALGGVLACHEVAVRAMQPASLPVPLRARIEPAVERYGWYVDRRAFGPDLYADGRQARLIDVEGRELAAQDHLELAWKAARSVVASRVAQEDLHPADARVSGAEPLPSESPNGTAVAHEGVEPASPFGAVLESEQRPGFRVTAIVARWDHTVFVISGRRRAFAAVPGTLTQPFLTELRRGALDEIILRYLDQPPAGRVLRHHGQTRVPSLFDAVVRSSALVASEREADGIARPFVRISAAVAHSGAATFSPTATSVAMSSTREHETAARPGKPILVAAPPPPLTVSPPPDEVAAPGPRRRWWAKWAAGIAVVAVAVIAGVFLPIGNGDEQPVTAGDGGEVARQDAVGEADVGEPPAEEPLPQPQTEAGAEVLALVIQGGALNAEGRFEEAIAHYNGVVARFGDSTEPEVVAAVGDALNGKGSALEQLGRSEEAIAVYDEVVARFGDRTEPEITSAVASALYFKGNALNSLGRPEEAMAAFEEVIDRFSSATDEGVTVWVDLSRGMTEAAAAAPIASGTFQGRHWIKWQLDEPVPDQVEYHTTYSLNISSNEDGLWIAGYTFPLNEAAFPSGGCLEDRPDCGNGEVLVEGELSSARDAIIFWLPEGTFGNATGLEIFAFKQTYVDPNAAPDTEAVPGALIPLETDELPPPPC